MTVADEGEVYWGLYDLIKKYGRSEHPWAQVIALRLFALEPANLPFQECWEIVKSVYERTQEFDETVGLHAALCETISAILFHMNDEQVEEARNILTTFESRLSAADVASEDMRDYWLGARDRVLELIETTERLPWGPYVPNEEAARELVNVDEYIQSQSAICGPPRTMPSESARPLDDTTFRTEEHPDTGIPVGGTHADRRARAGDYVGARVRYWERQLDQYNEAHKRDFDQCRETARTALTWIKAVGIGVGVLLLISIIGSWWAIVQVLATLAAD